MTIKDIMDDTETAYDEFRAKQTEAINYNEVCDAFNDLLIMLEENLGK